MGMDAVPTADSGDLAARRDAAREGRAAAMSWRRAPAGTAVATNGVADAHLGRALCMQRRRQMAQGKQALNGGGDRTAAAACAGVPTFIVHRGGAR